MNQKVNSIAEGLLAARRGRVDEARPGNVRNVGKDVNYLMKQNHPRTKPGSKFDAKKRKEYTETLGKHEEMRKVDKQIYDEIIHSREYTAFVNALKPFGMSDKDVWVTLRSVDNSRTVPASPSESYVVVSSKYFRFTMTHSNLSSCESYFNDYKYGQKLRSDLGIGFEDTVTDLNVLSKYYNRMSSFVDILSTHWDPLFKAIGKIVKKYPREIVPEIPNQDYLRLRGGY